MSIFTSLPECMQKRYYNGPAELVRRDDGLVEQWLAKQHGNHCRSPALLSGREHSLLVCVYRYMYMHMYVRIEIEPSPGSQNARLERFPRNRYPRDGPKRYAV